MLKIFETILNMSITGAVIIAFVAIIRLFMKRLPRKYSYVLWIIPAIRLLLPFAVEAPVSVFNFIHLPEQHAAVVTPADTTEAPVITEDIFTDPVTEPVTDFDGYFDSVPDGYLTGEGMPQYTGPVYTADIMTQPITDPVATPVITDLPDDTDVPSDTDEAGKTEDPVLAETSRAVTLWRAACAIWATGVIGMLCYLSYSYAATKSAVQFSYKIGDGLYSNGQIDVPFVFGYIKPKIYLPFGLEDKEFAYVVAHERTHVKRGDHIIKAIASLILCVHWFNPFAWLAFKLMTVDMELSCDERAIDTYDLEVRKEYARTLLNMSVGGSKVPFHGMLSFGESSIKSRIKGVLRMKKPTALACVIAVAVIITASVCLLTNARQTPPEPAGTTDVADTTDRTDTDAPDITDAPDTTEPVETTVPADTDEPPAVDGMIERCFENKLKDYTSTEMKIGITVPEEWSFDGDSATLNGKTVFSFVRAWPQVLGIDPDEFKKTFEGAEAIVEERIGGANDNFSYFMHSKNSKGHRYNYVLLCRGYYVNVYFFEESAVDDATKNAVLASVRVFNDKTKGVGDLIWLVSMDRYTIDVINVDNETVDYLDRSRTEEMFHITIRYVDFLNKHLNITGAPAKISEDVLGFSVTEDCIKYAAVDGVLYTKDMKTLVAFPPARTGEFVIPESVEQIAENAFYNSKLTKLIVPDSSKIVGRISGVNVEIDYPNVEKQGAVADICELSEDGRYRYYLLKSGLLYYRFYSPVETKLSVGDLVTVTFKGNPIFGWDDENITVNVVSHESGAEADTMAEHQCNVNIREYISVSNFPISLKLPSNWSFSGSVAERNDIKLFEVNDVRPFTAGISPERFKVGDGYEVTVVEEKYGTTEDSFVYYVHTRSPEKYAPYTTYDAHRYVVESNGWYVTVTFLDYADVPFSVVESILRSIEADHTRDSIGARSNSDEFALFVITLDETDVSFCAERLNDSSFWGVQSAYPPTLALYSKYLYIMHSPNFISSRTEAYAVSDDCILYTVSDGAIYTKNMETLVAFPPARTGEYTLPDSVKYIDDNAFYGTKLKTLILPASIERLGALNGADGVEVKLAKSEIEEYNVWGELVKKTVTAIVDGKCHKHVYTYYREIVPIDETYFYIDGVLQYFYRRTAYTSSYDRISSEYMQYYNADGTEGEYTSKKYDGSGRVVSETYFENGKPVQREYVYHDGVTPSLIYTVEDAVKHWLGNTSMWTTPAKGGSNPKTYRDLVINYEFEDAEEISRMYEDAAVAERLGFEPGSSVTVVKADFWGGWEGNVSVPIVVVKDSSGIYRAIDEVDVKTSTVTGVIIKKGDLSEDKSAREYRIYSNGWYYTFSLPASLDWEPCDKVTLSYVSFAGRSHLHFEEDSVQYRRFTNAEKLESAPISNAMTQTEMNLTDSTDSTVKCRVKLSLPNTWTVSGATAARSQIIHFEVAATMSPAASGIDLDLLRTYRGGLLNAVSEKKGTESDPYAYYVYAEAPDYPDWGVTEHVHCYAVFNNGYYVYMMFNADIGISPETLDGILRSVNVGSPWDDTVITISPPGNIINIRLGQGELYVNVQELSAENVEYLQSFLNEHSYMPQTVITFPNKQINFAASPTLISGRTERFEFHDMSLNYVTVDGAIYTKDMETLVAFPPARTGEYTLPDSVKYIDDNAFYGTKLTTLILPASIENTGKLIGAEGLAVEIHEYKYGPSGLTVFEHITKHYENSLLVYERTQSYYSRGALFMDSYEYYNEKGELVADPYKYYDEQNRLLTEKIYLEGKPVVRKYSYVFGFDPIPVETLEQAIDHHLRADSDYTEVVGKGGRSARQFSNLKIYADHAYSGKLSAQYKNPPESEEFGILPTDKVWDVYIEFDCAEKQSMAIIVVLVERDGVFSVIDEIDAVQTQ